jgi:DegV family protein with EDD domain
MSRVCILTDSTAQFTRTDFPGHKRVFIAPFDLQPAAPQVADPLPRRFSPQRLSPPSPQQFLQRYHELSRDYDSILVITLSSLLSPVTGNALSASIQFNNTATVEVLDSRTTASGLGWIVEVAAGAVSEGEAMGEIVKRVRAAIPRVYVLLFIPNLDVLADAGHLSPAQALVAGTMGMLPIFMLEDGRLVPVGKAYSQRAVLEYFDEFLREFESPSQVVLLHGTGHTTVRTRPLSQHIQQAFPNTHFSEKALGLHLAAMLGTQCICLAVMEKG